MFHGRSVFGDSVTIPDPTRSIPIGTRIPSGGVIPVATTVGTRLPVTEVRERTVSMPFHPSFPGQRTDYGRRAPIEDYAQRTIPIGPPRPVHEAIGPWRDAAEIPMPPNGGPLERAMLQRYAGIFHRPPTVGSTRYSPPHTFGVPVFSGTPDGLGGFRGLAGLIGYR